MDDRAWFEHRCAPDNDRVSPQSEQVRLLKVPQILYFDAYSSDIRYPINFCPYCGKSKSLIVKDMEEVDG